MSYVLYIRYNMSIWNVSAQDTDRKAYYLFELNCMGVSLTQIGAHNH